MTEIPFTDNRPEPSDLEIEEAIRQRLDYEPDPDEYFIPEW